MSNAIDRIRAMRGTMARISEACAITPGAVSEWRRVPAERVQIVAQITGIPPHELRPDIFLAPEKEKS